MSGIAHHLLKRGIDAGRESYRSNSQASDDKPFGNPHAVAATLGITALLWFLAMNAIHYVYGGVVATLTMIETPTATAFTVDPAQSDEVDAPLLSGDEKKSSSTEPELFYVKTKPITSKIRTTIKHLVAVAGPWSRFRGLQVAVLYHFVHHMIFQLLTALIGHRMIPQSLAAVATAVILCRLQMLWNHVVISAPSEKKWYRCFPTIEQGKKIILPTAVWAIAEQATIYVPITLFYAFNLDAYAQNPQNFGNLSEMQQKSIMLASLAVMMSGLVTAALITVPASVTLNRVQASLLSEEHDTIVPFDRTFGGRVQPAVVGGTCAVSMLDAWKTFDWAARLRLIGLYAKIFAIQISTCIFFVALAVFEVRMINGDYVLY
ncbi:MAG: hypothetical protein LQ345_001806 [Seirophora villosa]|nr:MAG: hypothetical protein LQ345_001806 [Seirophora villosa]